MASAAAGWLRGSAAGVNVLAAVRAAGFGSAARTGAGPGFGAGVTMYTEVAPTGAFRSAEQAVSSNAVPIGGSGSITMTNAFAFTAAGAVSLSSAAETFSASSTDIGRFAVLVMTISAAASQGTLTAETGTFSYDEV